METIVANNVINRVIQYLVLHTINALWIDAV